MDGLHPIGWAFDPEEAGLLRILDRSGRLFEWQVAEDRATELDAVEVGKGFALAPYFDSADGMPLLRDKRTYEIEKGGAYAAGGATAVKTDRSACPGRTTLARTVRDGSGTSWTGCQVGDKVVLLQRADGESGLDGRRSLRRRRAAGHPDADLGAAHRRLNRPVEGRRISRDPRGWRQIAFVP